jgi:hypothetical protein
MTVRRSLLPALFHAALAVLVTPASYAHAQNWPSGGFSASPVAAAGRIYLSSEDGDVFVVRAGRKFELLSTNRMGEIVMATPAISGTLLIVRTQTQLVGLRQS